MERFYAICPHCEKSILVEGEIDGQTACAACGHTLDIRKLLSDGYGIDAVAADGEYTQAQQYFMNNDFIAAYEHYNKVLGYNRNHYLAYYYAALCDLYNNEDRDDYDYAGRLFAALVQSVRKMGLCQANLQSRIEFLNAALGQTHILLSAYFNRMCDALEKAEQWDVLRDKCLQVASAVREIANVDKEQLMVYDGGITKYLVGVADIAICACRKVVQPHLCDGNRLDLPTDYCYERAKNCYDVLFYYAVSLDAAYKGDGYKPDYTENLLFNESVIGKLNAYNAENKSAAKKYLSTPGVALESFRRDAALAVKYSYHTCCKTFSADTSDKARIAIIGDAVSFCFELLMPRVHTDPDKRAVFDVKTYAGAKEDGKFLAVFLAEAQECNARTADEKIKRFFGAVYDTVKNFYTDAYAAYGRIQDKLKSLQNNDFRYYKNFLHTALYACAVALPDVVPVTAGTRGERLKLLKLGKQICDEFLLLNDYKVDELAQSAKYSDALDIFNAIDDCLTG